MHAPYVLNVATTNNRIRIPSRKFLQQYVNAAAEIGAAGVIVHGGHVLKDDDPDKGFDNWRKCIEGLEMPVPLLIENTAGGDKAMARRMERIERLWDAVTSADGGDTVGFCLDTCHAHAGGDRAGRGGRAGAGDHRPDRPGALPTTPATRSTPAPTGTPTWATVRSPPKPCWRWWRQAGAPIVVETPGGREGQAADIAWLRKHLD